MLGGLKKTTEDITHDSRSAVGYLRPIHSEYGHSIWLCACVTSYGQLLRIASVNCCRRLIDALREVDVKVLQLLPRRHYV
jgi:hypothetical protein